MTGFSNSESIIELASVLLTGTNSLFALTIIRPFGNKSLVFIVGILVTTKVHTYKLATIKSKCCITIERSTMWIWFYVFIDVACVMAKVARGREKVFGAIIICRLSIDAEVEFNDHYQFQSRFLLPILNLMYFLSLCCPFYMMCLGNDGDKAC